MSEKSRPRTSKQCKERWINYLRPDISFNKWSKKEEILVFKYLRVYGNHWSKIAEKLKGRTENSVKNYFYSTIRKNIRKVKKTLALSTEFGKRIKDLLNDPFWAGLIFCRSKECVKKLTKKTLEMQNNGEKEVIIESEALSNDYLNLFLNYELCYYKYWDFMNEMGILNSGLSGVSFNLNY
jgi:hypothetical protein